jgi:hypothetical protein
MATHNSFNTCMFLLLLVWTSETSNVEAHSKDFGLGRWFPVVQEVKITAVVGSPHMFEVKRGMAS